MESLPGVRRPFVRALFVALLIGIVAGCGGGGGGGGGGDNGGDSGGDSGGDDGGDTGGGGSTSFTVSGTATVASSTQSDSDTNEANAPASPNDTFAEAESTINPVTLGGYANYPGEGKEGRSFETGDVSDIFRVSLVDGQRLTLTIADPAVAADGDDPTSGGDLDLYLFPGSCEDGSCTPSACDVVGEESDYGWSARSVLTGETESLTISQDGDYFVEVCSYFGGSNYNLSIGGSGTTAAADADGADAPSLDDDFVPGDIVVRFRDDIVTASGVQGLYDRAAALGVTPKAGGEGRPMLMGIGGGDRVNTLSALGVDVSGSAKRERVARQGEKALLKWDTLRAIEALEERADVAYAEPNYIVEPLLTPSDGYYDLQWHYPAINLPQAWDITTGSDDVVVAVIDTGIRETHPDFTGQFVENIGYDFVSDPEISGDGDGIDPDPHDPGDGTGSRPSSWHGTHVAGTVAAHTNDTDRTVAGVAWDAKLMNLRALGVGGGTSYDVTQAIYYAAGLGNDSETLPASPADVINMSLGGRSSTEAQQDAIDAARAEGVTIVAAAGNDGTSELQYPASYNGVISVSAVDMNRDLAPYSSFGTEVDVAAPGGDTGADLDGDGNPDGILSTLWNEGSGATYGFYQGTSMAAPHVAGVIALMKAVNPELTPEHIDQLLADGDLTDDLGPVGRDDQFGHGLINALQAVDTARSEGGGSGDLEPSLAVTPGSLNFGAITSDIDVSVRNGGGGTLTGVEPDTSAMPSWLAVAPASTDEEGLGTYTVSVDRGDLDPATYSGEVVFNSNETAPVTVSVVMSVSSGDTEIEAGRHFMLLIDPDTGETLQQDVVDPADGRYDYSFADVEPGDYQVIGGTDFDNDGFICDAGEACGGYGSFDDLRIVTVTDADRTGIDFGTGFRVELQASGAGVGGSAEGYARLPAKGVGRDE